MNKRNINIDVIKGLAILSVIILHTLNGFQLLAIGAPLYIWQAVPIFMILQGLNNAQSFQRREFKTIGDFNDPQYISRKMKRLLLPYVIFFILQTIYLRYDTPDYFNSVNHLFRFLTGGRGPGSYFVPLTIQAQIMLPFIYVAVRKNFRATVIGGFTGGILLEMASLYFNIPEEWYRILIIRFVFALVLGVALSFLDMAQLKSRRFYTLVAISVIYIIGVMYFDWNFIMEKYWHSQHVPGFFWPMFLIVFLTNIEMPSESKILQMLALFGKASYHIFLTQLLYFWKPIEEMRVEEGLFYEVIINLLICTVVGLAFYLLEQKFWKKIEG